TAADCRMRWRQPRGLLQHRFGCMRPAAMYFDREVIGHAGRYAVFISDGADVEAARHMLSEYRIYTVEAAVRNHLYRAARIDFFGMLEDEDDVSRKGLFVLCQYACRSQHHCSMGIMSACMHDSRHGRFIRNILGILYGQCIKIRPESDRRQRLINNKPTDDTTSADALLDIKTELPQVLCDVCRCLHFLE